MQFPFEKIALFILDVTEKPVNSSSDNCTNNCQSFKRYIMIQDLEQLDTFGEIDWKYDEWSDRCVQLSSVVDAAVTLNDFTRIDNAYAFDLIEFFGDQYSINRILVTNIGVNNLINVKNGTILSLFGCSEPTQPSTSNISSQISNTITTTSLPITDSWATDQQNLSTVVQMIPLTLADSPQSPKATVPSSGQWLLYVTLTIIIIISIVIIAVFMSYLFVIEANKKDTSYSEKQGTENGSVSVDSVLEAQSSEEGSKPSEITPELSHTEAERSPYLNDQQTQRSLYEKDKIEEG